MELSAEQRELLDSLLDEEGLLDDTVDITGLSTLAPGSRLTVVLHHADGTTDEFAANHTMSDEHIAWFKAGSALNLLAAKR